MCEFRVRKTDDNTEYWTVADGVAYIDTKEHINVVGETTKNCFTFCCKSEAEAALDLYLSKQGKDQKDNKPIVQEIIAALEKIDFYGHPGFYKLLVKMADLHSRKNHDYAGKGNPLRNFYKCRAQGIEPWRGVLVRLSDKWSRLESFCQQGKLEIKEESVVDTLMDNAVYSLLAILLFEEERTEKTEGK